MWTVCVWTVDGEITTMALDGRAEDLFLGTSRGRVVQYDMRDHRSPRRGEAVSVSSVQAPVTALGFLIGDRTLVVGDGAGSVSTWQMVPPPGGGERRLRRVNRFRDHPASVAAVTASRRDKGFATADAGGGILVHYGTSGETLLSLRAEDAAPLRAIMLAPKADGVVGAHPASLSPRDSALPNHSCRMPTGTAGARAGRIAFTIPLRCLAPRHDRGRVFWGS